MLMGMWSNWEGYDDLGGWGIFDLWICTDFLKTSENGVIGDVERSLLL